MFRIDVRDGALLGHYNTPDSTLVSHFTALRMFILVGRTALVSATNSAIAARYDQTSTRFSGLVLLGYIRIWIRLALTA
jgi:hypothetical protein